MKQISRNFAILEYFYIVTVYDSLNVTQHSPCERASFDIITVDLKAFVFVFEK